MAECLWRILVEYAWYTVAEYTWCSVGECYWYIIGRLVTLGVCAIFYKDEKGRRLRVSCDISLMAEEYFV